MNRKRRSNRTARQEQLDQYVVLFGFGQSSKPLAERTVYRSVTLRIALRMVADREAETFVEQTDNGPVTFYRELQDSSAMHVSPSTLTVQTTLAVAARAMGDKLSPSQKRECDRFDHWHGVPMAPRRLDGRTRCYRSRRDSVGVLRNEPLAAAA